VVFVRYLNDNSLSSMQFNSAFESTKVLLVNPNFLFIINLLHNINL
jgi:hypothetical protein